MVPSELPIDGPIFELREHAGHPTYDIEIVFDPYVAHELDDVVDQLVAELPHRAGVAGVAHDGRERVFVRSGGVSVDRLQSWLDAWFREQLAGFESIEGD